MASTTVTEYHITLLDDNWAQIINRLDEHYKDLPKSVSDRLNKEFNAWGDWYSINWGNWPYQEYINQVAIFGDAKKYLEKQITKYKATAQKLELGKEGKQYKAPVELVTAKRPPYLYWLAGGIVAVIALAAANK